MGKNIYIGVDNVARKVKQPHIGVDNVARKVKSGFIGVDNVARQFFSGGTPLSALAVGAVVKLNESGVAQEYIVVNQGAPGNFSQYGSTYSYDSSCNGTWLLRKNCIQTGVWGSSSLNFNTSTIQNWMNSTMLSMYDSCVQNIIKQVKLRYYNGSITLGEVSCKVFPLSACEAGITSGEFYNPNGFPIDGTALSYFNGAGTAIRVAYLNGSAVNWWVRSPYTNDEEYAIYVSTTGWGNDIKSVRTNLGYRPALIMPFETLVNADMNIIAA